MRLAGHARIQEQQIEPFDFELLIERSGRKCVAGLRERQPHQLAGIVIARNRGERQLKRRQ